MIKINKIQETTCTLYDPNDNIVGQIDSYLTLNDVRIQVQEQMLSGYYLIWNNQRINIDQEGNIESWPNGFFDQIDKQLWRLLQQPTIPNNIQIQSKPIIGPEF